jgi:AcrR family transcriptional regulator
LAGKSINKGGNSIRRSKRSKGLTRRANPEATKADILKVAQEEFADKGLAGARVDEIAERTKTTKRAIYYYFGSKEGLYVAVLEKVYGNIREVEKELNLDAMEPAAAIRRLVEATFDYQEAHADFIRLVSIENIHNAQYLARSPSIRKLNVPVIDTLAGIIESGQNAGVFHDRIDPIDVHMLISALCFFRVSNRHTFKHIFQRDLLARATRQRYRQMAGDVILEYLAK